MPKNYIDGGVYLLKNGRFTDLGSGKSYTGTHDFDPLNRSRQLARREFDRAYAASISVWVYACIRAKRDAVSAIPWRVVNSQNEEIDTHPFYTAISYAYQYMQSSLFELWSQSLDIHGENYIERIRGQMTRMPLAFRWINPLSIDPQVLNGRVTQYLYNGDDKRSVWFSPQELSRHYYPHPLNDLEPLAPIDLALDVVNIDRDAKRAIKSWFANDATPGGIIRAAPGVMLNDNDLERTKRAWNERHKGSTKRGNTAFLPAALEYHVIQQSPVQSNNELGETTKEDICAVFGVPMPIAGVWNSPRYQVSPEMTRMFYQNTIGPLLARMATHVNNDLLPFFGVSGEFVFDQAFIEGLTRDKDKVAEAARSDLGAGVITINEYREIRGYGAVEGGDVLMLPVGAMLTPIDALSQHSAPAIPLPLEPVVTAPTTDPTKDSVVQNRVPFFVGLDLANNADLKGLQRTVKQRYPIDGAKWEDPADFHITVMYCEIDPAVVPDLTTAIQELPTPEFNLRVGSLASFDSVGEHALHFRVRGNAELREYQRTVHDLVSEYGGEYRSYYAPDAYKPHVTMGYLPEKTSVIRFTGNIRLVPRGVTIAVNNEDVYQSASQDKNAKSVDVDEMLSEIDAWWKFARNQRSKTVKRDFVTKHIKRDIEALIRIGLEDQSELKQLFDDAREFVKAYGETKELYKQAIRRLISEAQAEERTRRSFVSNMSSVTRRAGLQAMREGMNEVGYDPESFSKDELAAFRDLESEQNGFIRKFGAEIFGAEYERVDPETGEAKRLVGHGISESEIEIRVNMWADTTLEAFHLLGIRLGNSLERMVWQMGRAEEHCEDCPRLHGIVMTVDDWHRSGYRPRNGRTACKQGCKCTLTRTTDRLTPKSRLPRDLAELSSRLSWH